MTDNQKLTVAGLGGAVLLAWYLLRDTSEEITIYDDVNDESEIYDPYSQTNPGIYDGNMPGFNSVINVDVDPSMFGSLSRQYIPLFGMMGVVATGIAAPRVTVAAPPVRRSSGVRMSSRSRSPSTSTRRAVIGNRGSGGSRIR